MLDRILVQRAEAVTKTKGGIVIPEKAQQKVQSATVVAVGPGARNKDGAIIPMTIAVGDKVLLPEYGGTKVSSTRLITPKGHWGSSFNLLTHYPLLQVELEDKELTLFRESDILAKIEH